MTDAPFHSVATAARVRVWDPLQRLFHWSLVATVAVAWLTAEEMDTLHKITGYVIAGLVAFRLIWGFVGSRHARFARFVKGPRTTLAYLGAILRGRERRHLGHNPAGAAMIVALLLCLSGTALTGWLLDQPGRMAMLPALPAMIAYAHADEDRDERDHNETEGLIGEVHEALANLMLLLVALHVAGVALASIRHHENLPHAMVTGEKRAPGPGDVA